MTYQENGRLFDCKDCGIRVYSVGFHAANDQDLCAECTWLRAIEDPVEREKLRKFLSKEKPSITCPVCKKTSYNLNDIEQRYCGYCHKFHDQF